MTIVRPGTPPTAKPCFKYKSIAAAFALSTSSSMLQNPCSVARAMHRANTKDLERLKQILERR